MPFDLGEHKFSTWSGLNQLILLHIIADKRIVINCEDPVFNYCSKYSINIITFQGRLTNCIDYSLSRRIIQCLVQDLNILNILLCMQYRRNISSSFSSTFEVSRNISSIFLIGCGTRTNDCMKIVINPTGYKWSVNVQTIEIE